MQYLNLLQYFPQYKRYKREKLLMNFESGVYNYLKDMTKINATQSGCKRYFTDHKNKLVIRMSHRISLKLGYSNFSMTLETAMSYYIKNSYRVIIFDIVDGEIKRNILPEDEEYLSELK